MRKRRGFTKLNPKSVKIHEQQPIIQRQVEVETRIEHHEVRRLANRLDEGRSAENQSGIAAHDFARIVMLGLAELVKVAAFCDGLDIEVLDFAREPPDTITCCQMVGKRLAYWVALDASGALSLSACNADSLDEPQRILHGVAPRDWQVAAKTISALEFSQVASVAERPFEIVDRFGERWVIA
jgi:hypothetical protein